MKQLLAHGRAFRCHTRYRYVSPRRGLATRSLHASSRRPDIDSRYTVGKEESDKTRWHSFSGHERNSFFLNCAGQAFENASSLSGVDNIADSRVWVRWDYDHDGRVDIAMVNADYPLLNLYHNQVANPGSASSAQRTSDAHFLAIRLQGAHNTSQPNPELSNRDAFGARITLQCGGQRLLRAHTCGEGFSGQNSSTELIGLGNATVVDQLVITWPSGKTTQLDNVAADQQVKAYETAEAAPNGQLFHTSPYQPRPQTELAANAIRPVLTTANGREQPQTVRLNVAQLLGDRQLADTTRLLCFTTTATWCEACHRLQPRLHESVERWRSHVEFFGVPIDPIETPAELQAFSAEHQPAYTLLSELSATGREQVVLTIERLLNTQSIPCTLVTDRDGNVQGAYLGVPTSSDLGRLMMTRLTD